MKKIILLLTVLVGIFFDLYSQTGITFNAATSWVPYTVFGGYSACSACTTSSSYNAFLGAYSGATNTSGTNNSALGYLSLNSNATGNNNTAFGSGALAANTAGNNTAVGYNSLNANTTATGNTAVGYQALSSNTTASSNTAVGYNSLHANTTGAGNTALGYNTLPTNGTGIDNTAIGYSALSNNSQGNYNTAVGYNSLSPTTTGSQNTALGYNAGPYGGGSTLSNTTALGYGATTSSSNSVVIGNSSVTSIGGQVGWSTLSDGRFKTDVKEDVSGLNFIKQLRPVSYAFNASAFDNFKGVNSVLTDQQKPSPTRLTGFIAQEVETAAKNLGVSFSGVVAPQNEKDHYSLRYADFVVPLVKAVQELSAQIGKQKNQIDSLKKIIANSASVPQVGTNNYTSANFLYQNIPNPAGGKTVVPYQLQDNVTGQIIIFDMMGNLKKTIPLSNSDRSIEIQSGELFAGLYIYSLVVNGVEVASRRMVIN